MEHCPIPRFACLQRRAPCGHPDSTTTRLVRVPRRGGVNMKMLPSEVIGHIVVDGMVVRVWRTPCPPARYLGKCVNCKRTISALMTAEIHVGGRAYAEGDVAAHVISNGVIIVPCCGRNRELRAVRGILSEKHQCGARCMASKGPSCECSCGGQNHGASYA